MNDVNELKQFAGVHARGQQIPNYDKILDRIHHDGEGSGSWVGEWIRAAEKLASRNLHLEASRHYTMARFPFVDGPARQYALEAGVMEFDRWRVSEEHHIYPLDLTVGSGQFRCWTTGLSTTKPRPLLLIMGGIVTTKEQWAPLLARLGKFGIAAIVTELPRVGENSLCYDSHSWRMLSSLLDAVADRADVSRTYAMNLSFSGHLALRCATEDPRVCGVITVGAPITEFFKDRQWQSKVPDLTLNTLAYLTEIPRADLGNALSDWALSADQIAALNIPVSYVASTQDEIIPPSEVRFLRKHARDLQVLVHEDVHGAPHHMSETWPWCLASLFRMLDNRSLRGAVFTALWIAQRTRRRLTSTGY
ncbi:alpha/beta hydrolase [Nocardia sp. NPDC004654]|uniref:alpha/beta hydrolase n=1 Tax=Nocardia sp. NPDC004654 TaxID=3154776 RepID=UPI0033BA3E4D